MLRLRHAVRNGPRDPRQAAIAVKPFASDKRRCLRRAFRVVALTAEAGAARSLAVEDAPAQGDLIWSGARRDGQRRQVFRLRDECPRAVQARRRSWPQPSVTVPRLLEH
jgi:hypothetical protein